MKVMKLLAVALPICVGLMAAAWTTIEFWYDMKEGLIAFLGFLAASLVQVMPLTANFLQSDRLLPKEAERLTASLTKQQHYWIGLLSATIAAMVIVIIGSALKGRIKELSPLFVEARFWNVSWASVVCFLTACSVSFVLIKMLGLFQGMLSLHKLRSDLVLSAARRLAEEKIVSMNKDIDMKIPNLPDDYGKIVRPH